MAQNQKIAEKEKAISELNEQNAELKARLQTIELSTHLANDNVVPQPHSGRLLSEVQQAQKQL